MPFPTFPPTPASLADGTGKENCQDPMALQPAFELPPPALNQDPATVSPPKNNSMSPTDVQAISPAESVYPVQPAETVKSRRRAASSAAQKPANNHQAFALPPPPTRSRKIIQMKPRRSSEEESAKAPSSASKTSTSAAAKAATTTSNGSASEGVSKKKQPSATSAAGRKIARKTAHSLIERRRRSKMNEEFAVLKGMIPACTGEMHKLAILQASIEYIRYLEECITQLKEQRDTAPAPVPAPPPPPTHPSSQPPSRRESWQHPLPHFAPHYQGERSGDVDMADSGTPSPPFPPPLSRYQHPSVSPALPPEDTRQRLNSDASASTDHRRYSYSTSATTSPAFGPQPYHYGQTNISLAHLTSPALAPQREQRDLDQEATAALLMLNSDRRGTYAARNGSSRGMSVRDLLST